MTAPKDVFIFIEQDREGNAIKSALSLLTAARDICDVTGGRVTALCLLKDAEKCVRDAVSFGAERVITAESHPASVLNADACIDVLSRLIRKYRPRALFLAETRMGRAIAGGIAVRTKAPVTVHAETVRILKKEKRLIYRTASFGGFLLSDVTSKEKTFEIGLFRRGAYECLKTDTPDAEIIKETGSDKVGSYHTANEPKLIKSIAKPETDLESADIIVAGGRGAGGPEGFALIGRLADALRGRVGASRVAVDRGWAPKSALIGQSGKTVRPKLYITCGISGSVQHITGMRDADCIVSINSDPKALIFNVSDYCIVGDMFEILPLLIASIKERSSHGF